MNLGFQTVTIINHGTATGVDAMNEPIYPAPVLTVVTGCSVQQERSNREIDISEDDEVAESRYRLFIPGACPALTEMSDVVIGSVTWPLPAGTTIYRADGFPGVWYGATGQVDHIECYLREAAG